MWILFASHICQVCWPWPVALPCWVMPSWEGCLGLSMAEEGWDVVLNNWLHCRLPQLNFPFNLERLHASFASFPHPCTQPCPWTVQRLRCANIAELVAVSNVVALCLLVGFLFKLKPTPLEQLSDEKSFSRKGTTLREPEYVPETPQNEHSWRKQQLTFLKKLRFQVWSEHPEWNSQTCPVPLVHIGLQIAVKQAFMLSF